MKILKTFFEQEHKVNKLYAGVKHAKSEPNQLREKRTSYMLVLWVKNLRFFSKILKVYNSQKLKPSTSLKKLSNHYPQSILQKHPQMRNLSNLSESLYLPGTSCASAPLFSK